jgi:hypothetical protein
LITVTTTWGIPVYETSIVSENGTRYALARPDRFGQKKLLIHGNVDGFEGTLQATGVFHAPLTHTNANVLRQRLSWLCPVPLGLETSAGFGDRLGYATPGHVLAAAKANITPIFAQQSVRENTRIGRTPQQVMNDAMWGVFQAGWHKNWGADADHIKTIEDIQPFVKAGYTFYTIDPSSYLDDDAENDDLETLRTKAAQLPWEDLEASVETTQKPYLQSFTLDDRVLQFDEISFLKALAKYGAAIAHTHRMAQHLEQASKGTGYEIEMSVDETGTPTSLHEHFFIASELTRLGINLVSLAPRFVGRFEKGVDYIGDLTELEANIAGHSSIMRYHGNSYKLSLHTGSDKFSIYQFAMRHTQGKVHLKTAGTSYLEALRVISHVDPAFFREILELARARFEHDRKTYLISASLERVPESVGLADEQLPDLLNQFDAREVLHVTFGSILDKFGNRFHALMLNHEDNYHTGLKVHFERHLEAFAT